MPIARFVNERIFALKGGGYGCLFALTGVDEEGLTDQGLEAQMRTIEGALRGLPEGSCLYQYTRVLSGCNLPKKARYENPVTQVCRRGLCSHLASRAPAPRRRNFRRYPPRLSRAVQTVNFGAPSLHGR